MQERETAKKQRLAELQTEQKALLDAYERHRVISAFDLNYLDRQRKKNCIK